MLTLVSLSYLDMILMKCINFSWIKKLWIDDVLNILLIFFFNLKNNQVVWCCFCNFWALYMVTVVTKNCNYIFSILQLGFIFIWNILHIFGGASHIACLFCVHLCEKITHDLPISSMGLDWFVGWVMGSFFFHKSVLWSTSQFDFLMWFCDRFVRCYISDVPFIPFQFITFS